MATKTISVRIAGKKGKVDVEPRKGATVADVLSEAAALLGIPVPEGNAVLVDGKSQADVGARFGLAQCTVSQIVNNPHSHEYH